jgi:glycosyltransferase involved in cell wall biosynthesis
MGCRPKRVALFINELDVGGAQKQRVLLAKALKKRGDDVVFVTLLESSAWLAELQAEGIPVVRLWMHPRIRGMTLLLSAVAMLNRFKPHVVVTSLYQSNIVGRVAGKVTGVPLVISSIENERFGWRGRELLHRATDRLSAVTTVNSARVADRLISRGAVDARQVAVLPNATDVSPQRPDASSKRALRRQLGVGDDDFLWLAVGRLLPQKDYPTMLRALARLVTAGVPVPLQLRIAGPGPQYAELRKLAADLGLGERVALLGQRTDIPALLNAADGYVLSSVHEGQPNALMEALTAELPVVATDVGGVSELVQPGESGYVVPARNRAALSAAMLRVMQAPAEERRRMGAAGRRHICEHYSTEAVLARWQELIDGSARAAARSERAHIPASSG